jgi:hypothetical protein
MIKIVSDLRQVCGFLWVPYSVFPPDKTDRHDINEKKFNMVLNTMLVAIGTDFREF